MGGILASFDYSLLFWVDGITNLLAALLLYITLSPKCNLATEKRLKEKKTEIKNSVYKDKTYLIFIFLIFVFALCFFQFPFSAVYMFENKTLQVF